ncbi:carbohydrate binding domain-containing protein [Kribbella sp. NBC_01245]|uniref:carbohydrate binding domain-containing protein n=1 Tax=Kribbella sp. NBC_01245 TaxID=2903578 RepID=UPI002E2AC765|nr:carbohydrate binding domain-containing protein [Kribbella sp. NBC_01245]
MARRLLRVLLSLLIAVPTTMTALPAQGVKGGEHTTHAQFPWSVVITRPGTSLLALATAADTGLNVIGTNTTLVTNGKTGAGTTSADYDPVIKKVGLIESGDTNCAGPQVGSKITNYEALIRQQLGEDLDPPVDGVTKGGFETGTTDGWTPAGTSATVNAGQHGGAHAVRLGAATATNGESKVAQTFTVPSGSTRLSFWYSVSCPDTVTYAWARATLKDETSGTTSAVLAKTCTNSQGWKEVTATVVPGHRYTLTHHSSETALFSPLT